MSEPPPPDPRNKPHCDPNDALEVLKRLHESGHIAYFAGGCVRDTLLNLKPKDWDIATDAEPSRVRQLFPNTQAVGAVFGVILVRRNKSVIEVATFRADGIYEDGRRPSSVRFTSAEEDARRRDFTINGLFLDPIQNRVIDYVNGREDLTAKRIRAIGLPAERFAEDHLRLLRAVRFAARFSFEIEPATASAIADLADRVKTVSPERVGEELRLMLMPVTRNSAWRLLWRLKLAPEIFRFLPKIPQDLDLARSIFLNLKIDEPISFGLALAAATLCVRVQTESPADTLALLAKSEIIRAARALRQALRTSNNDDEELSNVLAGIEPLLHNEEPTVATKKRFLARPTSPLSRDLLAAMEMIGLNTGRISSLEKEFIDLSQTDVAPTPFITGDDLLAMSIQPGPQYRKILDGVYDAQLEGRIASKDEAIDLARKLKLT
jgi:tRNA nucleotidyltransferase/poly(A) polymerase